MSGNAKMIKPLELSPSQMKIHARFLEINRDKPLPHFYPIHPMQLFPKLSTGKVAAAYVRASLFGAIDPR